LYVRGWTQAAIAERVGVSQRTVSRYIEFISRKWEEEAQAELRHRHQRDMAHADAVRREAWQEWEDSKEPVRNGDDPEKTTITVTNKKPNERYLALALKCGDYRDKAQAAADEVRRQEP